MSVKAQIGDQTIKGVIIGAVAYFLVKNNVDAEAQAGILTAMTTVLAYASTKVGDKGVASFLAKAAKEAPKVVAEVQAEVAAKKAPAKKAPAKKAAPKKIAE